MLDTDLRVLVAGGDPLPASGCKPLTLPGRLLTDVLPAAALAILEGHYRAALEGRSSEFDYSSPVGGGKFRVRIRPLRDPSGTVVGVVSMSSDTSLLRDLQSQLEHARCLLTFGSEVYERRFGWVSEVALLKMWGAVPETSFTAVINRLVVAEERESVGQIWQAVLEDGGRSSFDYRIRHGESNQVRELHCFAEVVLGDNGVLLQTAATHVDVTDLVAARKDSVERQANATRERESLLRRVSGLLAAGNGSLDESLQATADLAATAIGERCLIRVISIDERRIERYAVSRPDWHGRESINALMAAESRDINRGHPVIREVLRCGEVRYGQGEPAPNCEDSWSSGRHYIVAPVRYGNRTLGTMTVVRSRSEPAFVAADADLVQVLSDRLGTMIDSDRVRTDQRELLAQLDLTEARERLRLAEAVHDEPMQLVAVALLRLDNLRTRMAEPDSSALDAIGSLLETSVDQLRTLIVTLTPPDLSLGLGPALAQLAEATFRGSATQVVVTGPDHVSLDPSVKESVYRILREALGNARKHAHAEHVSLVFNDTNGCVQLRLTDDGIGIGTADASSPGHLGLTSMRARAEAVHARLSVTSAPAGGTIVELAVPAQRGRTSEPRNTKASLPGRSVDPGSPPSPTRP